MEQINSKAIVLGMLLKADVSNPNAGWTEENVTVMKKIETPSNLRHPYISGQALRRYLRDTLRELQKGPDGKDRYELSPLQPPAQPRGPILTEGRPDKYIDDDLFGFMGAVKGDTKRRESPLRVSAAFGLFPYTGDRDLGTRSSLEVTGKPEAGGAVFETEITNNIFRTTWMLELDRVGCWFGYETTDESQKDKEKKELEKKELELPERTRRVKYLLEAIKYISGGGRRTRLLMEFVPQFIIYARLTKKTPIFLNCLEVVSRPEGDCRFVYEPLQEVISDYKKDIQRLIVGVRQGFAGIDKQELGNRLTQALGHENSVIVVHSVGEAIDNMIADIEQASF